MNKSIAINTCPALSSSADRRKQDKEAGRAIPPSPLLRGGVFSLALLRHPPVCIASYSPLQPLSRVLSDVRASGCVCARALRPLSLSLGSRCLRSDTAQPERTLARRSAPDGHKIPNPLLFPSTPPLSLYPRPPLAPTHSHYAREHKHYPTLAFYSSIVARAELEPAQDVSSLRVIFIKVGEASGFIS